jgi:hypothetical protein
MFVNNIYPLELEDIMLSEISPPQKDSYFMFSYVTFSKSYIEDWRGEKRWREVGNRYQNSVRQE